MLVANALDLLLKRIGKLDTPIEIHLKSAIAVNTRVFRFDSRLTLVAKYC